MKIASFSLRRTLVSVLVVLLILGGGGWLWA